MRGQQSEFKAKPMLWGLVYTDPSKLNKVRCIFYQGTLDNPKYY